jgi:hypothetical protein
LNSPHKVQGNSLVPTRSECSIDVTRCVNKLITKDPWQGTAWLVEGNPARPYWEYLPHAAAYTELVLEYDHPAAAVGFETDDSEMNLDLAAVNDRGRVLVLGEAKAEARQVRALATDVLGFSADPGKPPPRSVVGAPSGRYRDAWKLAHQLWTLRPLFLWLVASGERMAFTVNYTAGLVLAGTVRLPAADQLWPNGFAATLRPRVAPPV